MFKLLGELIEHNMFISRILVAIMIVLNTIVNAVFIYLWVYHPSHVTGPSAAIVATLTTVTTAIINSYFQAREKDKERKCNARSIKLDEK